jgi:hypothetical protein
MRLSEPPAKTVPGSEPTATLLNYLGAASFGERRGSESKESKDPIFLVKKMVETMERP